MPVTLWYRKNAKGVWEFNHIQDYYTTDDKPTPKFDSQKKAWKGGEWRKAFAHLSTSSPPKIMHPVPQWKEPVCPECHGTGLTDNHVTGETECSYCEGAGVI